MSDDQPAKRSVLQTIAIVVASLIALPVVVVILLIAENTLFGTRHVVNGIEAVGLTKVLQAIFDSLGMNG